MHPTPGPDQPVKPAAIGTADSSASTPCGLPEAGADPSGRPTAPVSPPGVPVEPADTVRNAAARRNRDPDVAVGGDMTRKIGPAAVVYNLAVDNLHAITVGTIAAAAL